MGKCYSHLTLDNRLTIEKLLRLKYKPVEIAKIIGCCKSTIYNELNRGKYIHHSGDFWKAEERYAAELAHRKYRENLKWQRSLKIDNDRSLAKYIENEIVFNKLSPFAVLMKIKEEELDFSITIKSVNTIYNYIKSGRVFPNLTMSHCPYRPKKKRKKKVQVAKRAAKGNSIEKRPSHVLDRNDFGHWEMDTVKGKSKNRKCLLVLTERKTRYEIIEVLKSCTTNETVKALNRIEKKFGSKFFSIFNTITVDNGSEFMDDAGIEKALYRVGKRAELFYCHPYSSFERGSNENQNKLIRRHYPKGSDFDKLLNKRDVKKVEEWVNTYPRKLFHGKCSDVLFREECEKLNSS